MLCKGRVGYTFTALIAHENINIKNDRIILREEMKFFNAVMHTGIFFTVFLI